MAGGSLESCEIRINWAGFFESYKQGIWNPPAVLTDYDLLVVTAGTGTCLINGKRHTLTARDVVLLRRGDEIRNPVTAGRLSNLFVHFDFMGGSGRPGDPPFRELPPRLSAPGFLSLVTALVERTIDAYREGRPGRGETFLKAALLALQGQAKPDRPDWRREHRMRLVQDIAERIMTAPATRTSVPELASQAGMSTIHFSRIFRRCVGSTPGEFMIRARVERAKLLLGTTSQPIVDIAEALGYRDEYHFCKQFKQKQGTPPATYRRLQKRP